MNKYFCLWDFDSAIYKAAASCEDSFIEVVHKKSGRVKVFKNLTEFYGKGNKVSGWLGEINEKEKKNFKKEDFDIIQKKKIIRSDEDGIDFIHKQIEAIKNKEWFGSLKLIVGGETNFRKQLDPTYKANRTKEKPLKFNIIKNYVINNLDEDVIVTDNCEADDYTSIMACWYYNKLKNKKITFDEYDLVIIGIDKDLNQYPSLKYNPDTKLEKPIWITETQAMRSLCLQLLGGDSVDNIGGLERLPKWVVSQYQLGSKSQRIGVKTASKLLADCESISDYVNRIIFLYSAYFCDTFKEGLQSQYQLIKLQEKKGEVPDINDFIKRGC